MMVFRLLLVAFFPLSFLYSMSRSVSALRFDAQELQKTQELEKIERAEVLSPKGLGIQLVRSCREGKLRGFLGIAAIKDFLSKSCDLDVCDRQGTALMWASFFGQVDIANLLLEHKASVHTTSDLGYTPLHAAAQRGCVVLVKTFIEKGTAFDVQAHCGSTPLHLAAQEGKIDVVEYLLGLGANLEMRDIQGRTPLHLAAWKGHDVIVRILLKACACVDVMADDGITPLLAAAFGQSPEVIELLCMAQANIYAATKAGDTIITLAVKGGKNGLDGMVNYLEGLLRRVVPKKNDAETLCVITL